MTKLKAPLFSLSATGRLGKLLALARRRGRNIIEKLPTPTDAQSPAQLFSRHMFTKCVDLWHTLSEPEKQAWESAATPRHMTGYAWYISQCLRPNPGIYLPLQGGVMQGIIEMDGFAIQDMLDPVNPQDADTEAARDAAIAAAIAGSLHCDIYAYDGSNWQDLRVESATHHNLRVRLYAAANPIANWPWSFAYIDHTDLQALATVNSIYLWQDANRSRILKAGFALGDADNALSSLPVTPWVYNGVTWDKLRSWATGILKVGRAAIGLSTLRQVGVGQVKAAAGELYWMNLNPSAGLSAFELTDDLNGLGAVVLDHFDTTRDGHMLTFDPPMEFTTGIYLKTLTNMTSITFGYK